MFSLYANWKSYKNLSLAREWFDTVRDRLSGESSDALTRGVMEIVIFPPSPLTYPLHVLSLDVEGIRVGIQDISPYGEGKHTGLVNASSVSGIATHVIIGHIEQRKRGDTVQIVDKKYREAIRHLIHPILCISTPEEQIREAPVIAFEPASAIGTGSNASVAEVVSFKHDLLYPVERYIYGGSVTRDNCKQYLNPRVCDGFLVSTASLDPAEFVSLVDICARYAQD